MNKKLVFAAFAAAALLAGAGCGGGGNSANSANQPSAQTSATQTMIGSYRGIGYRIITSRQAKLGERVGVEFDVTNNRDTPLDGVGYDFRVVVRQNNAVIYDTYYLVTAGGSTAGGSTSSTNRALYSSQLPPKGVWDFPYEWDQRNTNGQPVSAGTYSIQMYFVPAGDLPVNPAGTGPNDSDVFKYGPPPVDVVVTP